MNEQENRDNRPICSPIYRTAKGKSPAPADARAYMAVLDGVLGDAEEELLIRRLDHHLDIGYARFFVDTEEVVSGIGDLRERLCRWGVENRARVQEVHVLVPSMAALTRMALTSLFVGDWLRAHGERIDFMAAITGKKRTKARKPTAAKNPRFHLAGHRPRARGTLPYVRADWRMA